MAENKNMELSDEMMGVAIGGRLGELGEAKYQIGQNVNVHFGKEENGETIVTNLVGPIIGIEASPICWQYTIELQANGRVYTIKMPEFALDNDNP